MGALDFLRMRNIFGGAPMGGGGGSPSPLPSHPTYGSSDYTAPSGPQLPKYDENIDVYPDDSAIGAFKRSVMAGPPGSGFEFPKNTNAGLDAALKIAAEPSPLEKNRYYIGDQAYQKQGVIKDPVTGQKKYVTNVHEPSFMSQVMRAMPAAASPAVDILNAPGQQAEHDWEMRNKWLKEAAGVEKTEDVNRSLAAQRYAQAATIPQREQRLGDQGNTRLDQAQQKIDQNQQKLDHIMSRQDLSDSEKIALTSKYKKEQMNLQGELNQALQETKGGQRMEQIGAKGEVDKDIQELRGTQRQEQISATGEQARETVGARGEQARETKAVVPGGAGATSQLPSQQKVALQIKANKAKQEHPEWSRYISTDPNTGMVEIAPPATGYFSRGPDKPTYDAMVAYMSAGGAAPAKEPAKAPTAAPPPKRGEPVEAGRVKVADESGKIIATIPEADVAKLNKKKYHVVK